MGCVAASFHAESCSQPDSGSAIISRYSRKCATCAAIFSHDGNSRGNGGGLCDTRHKMRMSARPSTVMPIDLWVSTTGRTQSSGNESALRPSTTLPIISSAISQCRTMAVRV